MTLVRSDSFPGMIRCGKEISYGGIKPSDVLLVAANVMSSDIDTPSLVLGLDPEEVERAFEGGTSEDQTIQAIMALGDFLRMGKTAAAGDPPSRGLPHPGSELDLIIMITKLSRASLRELLDEHPLDSWAMLEDDEYAIFGFPPEAANVLRAIVQLATIYINNRKVKRPIAFGVQYVMDKIKFLNTRQQESFIIGLVNVDGRITREVEISRGDLIQAPVTPFEVLGPPLRARTPSIILFHNHPGWDEVKPSPQDISTTNMLIGAAKPLGIKILDHIIVGNSGYYSFLENGLIGPD